MGFGDKEWENWAEKAKILGMTQYTTIKDLEDKIDALASEINTMERDILAKRRKLDKYRKELLRLKDLK